VCNIKVGKIDLQLLTYNVSTKDVSIFRNWRKNGRKRVGEKMAAEKVGVSEASRGFFRASGVSRK